MTRDELIELTRKIMFCDASSEQELDAMFEVLEKQLIDPCLVNYFKSNKYNSPEKIVDKALQYKPICLPVILPENSTGGAER